MNHHIRTAQHGQAARRDTWTRTDSGRTTWHHGCHRPVAPRARIA